jgi:hypothetical protein
MYLDNYHYYIMARVQHLKSTDRTEKESTYLSVASSDSDDGSDVCSSYGVANVNFFFVHILTRFLISLASSFRVSSCVSASFSHSF